MNPRSLCAEACHAERRAADAPLPSRNTGPRCFFRHRGHDLQRLQDDGNGAFVDLGPATATATASACLPTNAVVMQVAGAGSCAIPLALSPGLAGATFFRQGYGLDPSAPSLFNHSNGLELHVGF